MSESHAQKVALVLSGGGAKGIAHVGVIKALEENDIPIDYVVGTSMGGIISGCYAAGFSADRIEDIVTSEEFRGWVNGELEKGYNYYYNKDDPDASFLSIKLSLDSTFNASISSSLASDLALNYALAENFAQPSANANYNYDSLFVPARIVAADIFTQHEVVMSEGSLSQSLRATLSVPFFYKPIRIDGKYLFDGGIYNNFPVDVALRDFEPDVIIGVNVSSKVFNEYPYDNDEKLLSNSLLYMLLDKTDPSIIPSSGVYIEPDLNGYTAFDFSKAEALVDSGYAWAMKHMDEIKAKVQRRENCDSLSTRRNEFNDRNKPLLFKGIKYHGFNSKQRRYINKVFKTHKKDSLFMDDIKSGYFKLVSESFFQTIYPDITFDNENKAYQLEIFGRPRNNFNVDIGGTIASRNVSQIFLGLEYYFFDNYLLKNSANFYTGSFYKSAQVKSKLNLSAFNQFYLEPEFTFNDWDYIDSDDILSDQDDPTILQRTDRKYGLNIGFPVGTNLKGVITGSWINNNDSYSNTRSFTTSDTLDELSLHGIKAGLYFMRDDLNRKQYPDEGQSFEFSINYFNLKEEYEPGSTTELAENTSHRREWFRVKATAQKYFKTGRFSTGYIAEGVLSNQPFFSNYYGSLINAPGFNPIQDSRTLLLENFRAYNYVALGLRGVFNIRPNLDFRMAGYAFKGYESLNSENRGMDFNNTAWDKVSFAGNAGFVLHSPVGPIALTANYYDDSENKFGVLLHVGFLLFNKRSTE
ncbi:patatin-like phospholipase family protein [Fulvivirga maritima]|uniref:patatin-like phospholipase family protein n=1 Tax=Fulvivirga maritima TaxID=2904247 RepID=UPI001F26CD5F|nr:patatin-like phospholipase family protein [Fulvivirga maritima]UII28424.1 patatin-like phospholipase family protein [Fulvivirga maritima]